MRIDFGKVEGVMNHVLATAKEGDPASVVLAVDEYMKTVWMMAVGKERGQLMDAVINDHKPKVLLELGGYFGYSAIRFAASARSHNPDAHYYSIELSPVLASVIEKLARFAGLGEAITVLSGDLRKTLPSLKKKLQDRHGDTQVGFMLLDHDKPAYTADLLLARKEGLIKQGSVIVADNILWPGAPEYKKYMEADTGLYTSRLVPVVTEEQPDAVFISIVN